MIRTALPLRLRSGQAPAVAERQESNFLFPLFLNGVLIYAEFKMRYGVACALAYGSMEGIILRVIFGTVKTVP
ncbi:MAG: hypothetical protein A3H28_00915 [Acidobacteria bacterium RIFCSPLOWO2_02_FULL_61_28]|nr:MAG: hypothetical protein A3H28_00915 [Acidobacteria bacterium RIFCSPLOWO2_02_FULL_61_28]